KHCIFFGVGLTTLPPFFAQSAALSSTQPCPLQAFFPAHECSAVAQEAWPLHELTPAHSTVSPPAFSSARAATPPARISVAAALAINIPLLVRMRSSSVVGSTARLRYDVRARFGFIVRRGEACQKLVEAAPEVHSTRVGSPGGTFIYDRQVPSPYELRRLVATRVGDT